MDVTQAARRAQAAYTSPEAAARYEGVHRGRARHRREERCIARAFRDVPPGSSVLDLPCGAGRMFPVLARLGLRVTAVDGSAAMAERAARTAEAMGAASPVVEVRTADVLDTGFPDDAFDAVLSNRLFHHFPEPELRRAGLAELRRICTGPVVVSFFCSHAWEAWRTRSKRRRRRRNSDRDAVSYRSFRSDVEAAGLVVERVHRTLPGVSQQWYVVARRPATRA